MNLTITGLEQVQKQLRALPSVLAAKALQKGIDQAAGVIAAEVEARTPIGEEGLLAESVIVKSAVDLQKGGVAAAVGFASTADDRGVPQDLIAFWVEYGHQQTKHDGRTVVGHVPAHPFMRPAFDASADRAIAVFADVLIDSLSELGDAE